MVADPVAVGARTARLPAGTRDAGHGRMLRASRAAPAARWAWGWAAQHYTGSCADACCSWFIN